jgi:transcriptional regulator with XRE-family HTH domain
MEVSNFGDAFRQARVAKKITIREVANYIKKSIGYVSDIEHNRKLPPDLDSVRKIEEFLNLKEGSLVEIALRIKKRAPSSLAQRIRARPVLSEVLLRAENLSDEEIKGILSEMEKKEGD